MTGMGKAARRRVGAAAAGGGMLLAVLSGAGCTDPLQGQWENPRKPWEAWAVDRSECLQLATERAEHEFALARAEAATPGYSRIAGFEVSMSRFEATRRRDRLFERCMIERGYRLVPRVE